LGCQYLHMSTSATHDLTQLLTQWANGDQEALNQLTPLVYKQLRRLAAVQFRKERKSHTLQPTVLVHEAYLRLVDQRRKPDFQSRAHFFRWQRG
jgi:RNA polymerase sigma factor (TIGR02999 family)